MSSRPLTKPHKVITNGNMSAPITSEVTVTTNLSMLSYAFSWVGTAPIGVIDVQVSNDFAQNVDGTVRTAGTWNSLPLSSTPNVTNNSDTGFIDIDAMAGYALRVVYTPTSGTGLLQCTVAGKVK